MNNIPIIAGDRLDGLKETLDELPNMPSDFNGIQKEIHTIMLCMVSGLQKLWSTMNWSLLTTKELVSVSLFFGLLALLQVYLSLT